VLKKAHCEEIRRWRVLTEFKKALKKFQIQKGLPDSGELDSATRTTLNIE